MRIKNLFKTAVILLFIVLTNATALFAQGNEACDGTDPDANCPIDTLLPILIAAVVVFFGIYTYRKRAL